MHDQSKHMHVIQDGVSLDFRGQEGTDHSESAKTASCSSHALSPQTRPRTLQPLCVLDEEDGVGRGLCSFLYQLQDYSAFLLIKLVI